MRDISNISQEAKRELLEAVSDWLQDPQRNLKQGIILHRKMKLLLTSSSLTAFKLRQQLPEFQNMEVELAKMCIQRLDDLQETGQLDDWINTLYIISKRPEKLLKLEQLRNLTTKRQRLQHMIIREQKRLKGYV